MNMRLEDRVAMLEEKLEVQADTINQSLAILTVGFHPAVQNQIVREMAQLMQEWQDKDDAIHAKYKAKCEEVRKPDGERNG